MVNIIEFISFPESVHFKAILAALKPHSAAHPTELPRAQPACTQQFQPTPMTQALLDPPASHHVPRTTPLKQPLRAHEAPPCPRTTQPTSLTQSLHTHREPAGAGGDVLEAMAHQTVVIHRVQLGMVMGREVSRKRLFSLARKVGVLTESVERNAHV